MPFFDEVKRNIVPPDYASAGYTSGPPEENPEPEGTDEDSSPVEPLSNPKEFKVEASISKPLPDVTAFRHSLDDGINIFMERRERYGNHLENAVRFPLEDIAGLYLKCVRFVRMVEAKYDFTEPIDDDTLIDLPNYAHMIRSRREG